MCHTRGGGGGRRMWRIAVRRDGTHPQHRLNHVRHILKRSTSSQHGSGSDGAAQRLAKWWRGQAKSQDERGEGGEGNDAQDAVVAANGASSVQYPRVLAVPLQRRPLLPGILLPVNVADAAIAEEIQALRSQGRPYVGAFLLKENFEDGNKSMEQAEEDMHEIGCFAQVHAAVADGKGGTQVLLMGHRRLKRTGVGSKNPLVVDVEHLKDHPYDASDDVIKATVMEVVSTIKDLLQTSPLYREQLQYFAQHSGGFHDASKLADLGAALTSAKDTELQEVLEQMDVPERLNRTLLLLKKELELSKLQIDIGKKVEEKISGDQRRYFLMEQLKNIKKELGIEKDEKSAVVEKFRERVKEKGDLVPKEAAKTIEEEINKLQALDPSSSEFNVTRNYLDWLTGLPWGVTTEEVFDIDHARKTLDEDHYGMDDVKERILEFIAVGKLSGSTHGKILLLSGPPGVGKTSIGKSIAKALNRKYYRFSVGGLGDVAELKGHRRTYVGAMPGKLVQCFKSTQSCNPLVLIDEIDKLGRGHSGDPASALLEILDPEQNATFMDHYLDVPMDLSKVLFVCTANMLETIPGPLYDRMENIRLSGYIAEEKFQIARRYLDPQARDAAGLRPEEAGLTDSAIRALIDDYAREAGVRNLKKLLERVYRKLALKLVQEEGNELEQARKEGSAAPNPEGAVVQAKHLVTETDLEEYVGPPVFAADRLYEEPPTGVITGLAWTSMGGSVLYIEAGVLEQGEGKGGIRSLTGQLGEVMRESASIAHSCARSILSKIQPDNRFFSESALHIHVPAGATPKDGPSAGITIATALLSLAMGQPAKKGIAMTGELSLTGRVLPIGGIKEKAIAAKRAKIKEIILPEGNRRDWKELPQEVKDGLDAHFVKVYDEVFKACFGNPAQIKWQEQEEKASVV